MEPKAATKIQTLEKLMTRKGSWYNKFKNLLIKLNTFFSSGYFWVPVTGNFCSKILFLCSHAFQISTMDVFVNLLRKGHRRKVGLWRGGCRKWGSVVRLPANYGFSLAGSFGVRARSRLSFLAPGTQVVAPGPAPGIQPAGGPCETRCCCWRPRAACRPQLAPGLLIIRP